MRGATRSDETYRWVAPSAEKVSPTTVAKLARAWGLPVLTAAEAYPKLPRVDPGFHAITTETRLRRVHGLPHASARELLDVRLVQVGGRRDRLVQASQCR